MRHTNQWSIVLLAAGLLLFSSVHTISAAPLEAGFDLFETDADTTSVSHPMLGGTIALVGVPIDPGLLGYTDTIVRRTNPVGDGSPGCAGSPIPPGCLGGYDIELVALNLRSAAPVDIGGSFFDVFVTIDALGLPSIPQYDALSPSVGVQSVDGLDITFHDDSLGIGGGGTFGSSFFDVFADVILTLPGGNPNDASQVVASMVVNTGRMTATGVWSHVPRVDDPRVLNPTAARLYPAGNFYPGVDPQTLGKVLTMEEAALAAHGVLPGQAVPEASTVLLLGGGLALLTIARWRVSART